MRIWQIWVFSYILHYNCVAVIVVYAKLTFGWLYNEGTILIVFFLVVINLKIFCFVVDIRYVLEMHILAFCFFNSLAC